MADLEGKSSSFAGGIAHAAAAFASTPFPYLLGLALMFLASKWDGHIHSQNGCFELKEIGGVVYKFDSCSGKTEQISEKKELPVASNTKPLPTPSATNVNHE